MAAPEENVEYPIAFDDEGRPRKLRFTTFGSAEDSLRAERELAEEARREAARFPIATTATATATKKPGRKPAANSAPMWSDGENLELLKLVRDDPNATYRNIAGKLNAKFWVNDPNFAGRTINGCRPQYTKVMGGKRELTIGVVPAKIKELEDKIGN